MQTMPPQIVPPQPTTRPLQTTFSDMMPLQPVATMPYAFDNHAYFPQDQMLYQPMQPPVMRGSIHK